MLRAREIISIMNKWADPYLVDDWDNTGFQIGNPNKEIKRILVALDLDRIVLEKAKKIDAQMIITHHPLIFKPLNKITTENFKERLIYDIIKEDIVVYNAHSNLDIVLGGVNDTLAKLLGLKNTETLRISYEEPLYKVVVFVPNSHSEIVRNALGEAKAGWIGNYSHCTYNLNGFGTFMPREGTNPFIGNLNKLEKVDETRIETIVEERNLNRVVRQMIKVHPYEEVAYDVYPLKRKGRQFGYGRVGNIEEISLKGFLNNIKEKLDVSPIKVYGYEERNIRRVALCGGSGANFIYDAYKKKADLYITGDVKYHDAQLAYELGLVVVDANHFDTEKVILPKIKNYICKKTENKVEVILHKQSSPPVTIY